MPDDNRLIEIAMHLRAAAPDTWDSFIAALDRFAAHAANEMLRCSTSEALFKQQGVATGLNQLAGLLKDAPRRQRNA